MTDYAFFCPTCGSAAVDTSSLAGSAECRACSWSGSSSDLVLVPVQHTLGSPENIAHAVFTDLRKVLAKDCSVPLGSFLLKWGFLSSAETPQGVVINTAQLGEYMTAISTAVYAAILETREKIEKERASV